MNVQAITEFLDLVKNPDKYATYLKELQEKQDYLDQRIAAVGTISELDGLKQKAEKLVNVANKKAEKIEQEAQVAFEKRQAVYDDMFAKLRERELEVSTLVQKAESQLLVSSDTLQQALLRNKDLDKKEKQLQADKEKYDALLAEYEEKVAKLRSVMV